MAQSVAYTPFGGLQVKADSSYTKDNVPATTNVVVLTRGVRIYDEAGNKTPLRGVRVLIEVTGLTAAVNPLDNVPQVWLEGEELTFHTNGTYTFFDDGLVMYGIK